ncbi:lyase family protein [Actinacidiphila acidipaludis]|uniref:3-carboxy-cis,cis-muconate cycloisomerase n=1 Tax=Actinacidiphila acidipaludis TaxID=2873382 RepID=A0ABS7QHE1_9ACTN|nr:lyase family protein [Streptomyces acidipaludis]MBY8882378.1 3-carboxy-cis,cis-muconate cycloisomerase [Streptomyces acidipaludis]
MTTPTAPTTAATPGPAPAEGAPPLETGLLAPVWAGTPAAAAVSDAAWLTAMLRAEAALARAQARLGAVPAAAATAITATAATATLDLPAIARAARESANPVVALVRHFTAAVAERDEQAAAFVHRGSTSQDILDTATVLVAGHALAITRADLAATATALTTLAHTHHHTLMAGRTLALHAVPTTFGLKAAGWRHLVLDAIAKIDHSAAALTVQLGGAAGTLAGYLQHAPGHHEDYAGELTAAFAAELGLGAPLLPWHVLRTPIADLAGAAAFVCAALGKIAVDVLSLTRTEVGEVHEGAPAGRGASSAMPHKRNPVLATAIRSAALQAPPLAATVLACVPSEDERSAGAWHAEWEPLRALLRLAGGAAAQAAELCTHLETDPARMRANTALTHGQIVSEKITAHLAPLLGPARARRLLTDACTRAAATGRSLRDVLSADPAFTAALQDTGTGLDALFDPAAYTGAAAALTTAALSRPLPAAPAVLSRLCGAPERSG